MATTVGFGMTPKSVIIFIEDRSEGLSFEFAGGWTIQMKTDLSYFFKHLWNETLFTASNGFGLLAEFEKDDFIFLVGQGKDVYIFVVNAYQLYLEYFSLFLKKPELFFVPQIKENTNPWPEKNENLINNNYSFLKLPLSLSKIYSDDQGHRYELHWPLVY
jgi:hypothetical protein